MGSRPPLPPVPRSSVADALFPKVRQRVLAVLFDAPERSFYMGEVIALAHSGTGAVQRELADMAACGILSVHKRGKQKHYQANAESPVFEALRGLVAQTMGVGNVLKASLQPVAQHISAAFVYNEPPPSAGTQPGAVHVVLFGAALSNETHTAAVTEALQTASNTMARQLKFSVHTPRSVAAAMADNRNFLNRLLQPPKTWLIGSEEQLFEQGP